MSAFLYTKHGEQLPNLTPSATNDLRKTLIVDLIKYLEKPRQLIDIRSHSKNDQQWGLLSSEGILEIPVTNIYGERAIFPGFPFKNLTKETEEEINDFRQNNEELYQIAFGHRQMGNEFKCLLCCKTLTSVPEAQIHVFRKLHRDRTMQYGAEFDLDAVLPDSKKMLNETSYYSESFYSFKY